MQREEERRQSQNKKEIIFKEALNTSMSPNRMHEKRIWSYLLLVLAVLAVLGSLLYFKVVTLTANPNTLTTNMASTTTMIPSTSQMATTTTIATAGQQSVEHVILIVLENKNASYVLNSSDDPYIRKVVIPNYSVAEDYYAVAHPSLPNYVALMAGSTFDIKDNKYPIESIGNSTLVDLLSSHHLTWKAYMESIPSKSTLWCSNGTIDSGDDANGPGYVVKHDPFVYFKNVMSNIAGCRSIVPLTSFYTDLANNQLPQFSFITPNALDDGHTAPNTPDACPPSGTTLRCADTWLSGFLPIIINSKAFFNTVVFIVWDEATPYSGANKVLMIMVSPYSKKGFVDNTTLYSHYSVLATIERIYSLGDLGRNDSTANVISDMFAGNSIP